MARGGAAGIVLNLALAVTLPGRAETFNYQAFIGGAMAGKATVNVTLVENRYEVSGTARAEGVVDVFSDWRTRFQAHGQLLGATPELIEYSYVERDAGERREVTVRDGVLTYFKNGRKRRERASPGGLDVLTVLFVRPSCVSELGVHSGRREFRLTRLESRREGVCRYRVVDDDDDHYEAEIRFDQRHDLTVPTRITVHGFLTGKMVLVDQ